jgi:drug/metabolite transporter (DMT)-like permease
MAGGVFISSISQILLKKSALDNADSSSFKAQYLNKLVICGYALLLIAMLIPLYVYQFMELKYGAVVESLGYVFVMILSSLVLGEKITKKKLAGNVLIIIGIVLFSSTLF